MKLTARQIERLVKQGEVVHTECKDASGGLPDALWESYSSFANTDGGDLHPNIAGLVCFGDFVTIMHELPNYFLDYRERSSDSARWGDRVCSSDPTWSGNIVDFFYRIYDKVTSGVKTPFALDENDRRIDETDVHEAVREVVANALIHADYHGRQGIVVEKRFNEIQVSNPGTMRISKEIAIEGGRSDPRNAQVFNIFSLIGIGERSGTGLSNLYALWNQHGFATPVIREEFAPEKTIVSISTGLDNNQTINEGGVDNKSALMSSLDNNSQSSQGAPRPGQDPANCMV